MMIFTSLYSLLLATSALVSRPFVDNTQEVHTLGSWSWSDCGAPSDAITIHTITVSPDPPKPGDNLTVTVFGDVHKTVVDGAEVEVSVKLGLIRLLKKTFDICEEARNAKADVQCPIEQGTYNVTQTVPLPREIPPASFGVEVRGFTADDDDMVCLNLKANFMP